METSNDRMSYGKHLTAKELTVRWVSIALMAVPTTWSNATDNIILNGELLTAYVIHFVSIALIWNSTMFFGHYFNTVFRFLKLPMLFATQLFAVSVGVTLITWGEFWAIERFAPYYCEDSFTEILLVSLAVTFFISMVYTSVFLFKEWKINQEKTKELEKANIEARFETLKTQVNPHFLFNSLNVLLTMVADNPAATKYVENLSELMRYMLQNRSKEVASLHEELDIARKYIYIQQQRFESKLQVTFDIDNRMLQHTLPPLALQMLLENAIKHNVISDKKTLTINVRTTTDSLLVTNNLQPKIDAAHSTGIGLQNISARYKYLFDKEIEIIQNTGSFAVRLPLVKEA